MKITRKIGLGLATFAGLLGLVLATGGVAHASGVTRICGNAGSGYCLNDWGGADAQGDAIKMYYGGNSNENFWVHHLTTFCGGLGYIGSSCTSQWGASGGLELGNDAVMIVYGPGGCIGSDNNGLAILTSCPNDSGVGGGTGTVFAYSNTTCFGCAHTATFASRPWSHSSGQIANLESGGNVGFQANMICTGGCTNWGGSGVTEQ